MFGLGLLNDWSARDIQIWEQFEGRLDGRREATFQDEFEQRKLSASFSRVVYALSETCCCVRA